MTSKEICCLCCTQGPLSINFTVEREGYVPGETINIEARFRNETNNEILTSTIELSQVKNCYLMFFIFIS